MITTMVETSSSAIYARKRSFQGAEVEMTCDNTQPVLALLMQQEACPCAITMPRTGRTSAAKCCASYSMQGFCPGYAKANQDSVIMLEDCRSGDVMVACFDGHGAHGDVVSQFVKQQLERDFSTRNLSEPDIRPWLRSVLLDAERELERCHDQRVSYHSGTTVALAVIQGDTLTVANIGDSRTVLGRRRKLKIINAAATAVPSHNSSKPAVGQSPSAVPDVPSPTDGGNGPSSGLLVARQLSVDHKPDRRDEYTRILASGGRVFSVRYEDGVVGPPRVWLQSSNTPGLAMSRSLGDLVVHAVGVSSEPEVFQVQLHPMRDRLLVVATDGLWDVMTNDEVVNLAGGFSDPQAAVLALMRESHARWLRKEEMSDDTSICLVHLRRTAPTSSPQEVERVQS